MKLTSIITVLAFAFAANATEPTTAPAATAAPATTATPAAKNVKLAKADKMSKDASGDVTTAKKGKKKGHAKKATN